MMIASIPATPRNPGLGFWSELFSKGVCSGCPGQLAYPMGPCTCDQLKTGGVMNSPGWITPPAPQIERQMTVTGAWTPDVLWAIQTQRGVDTQTGQIIKQGPSVGTVKPPPPKDEDDWFSKYKWWLLGGAVLSGVALSMGSSRGYSAAKKAKQVAGVSTIAAALPVLLIVGGGLFLAGGLTGGVGVSKILS